MSVAITNLLAMLDPATTEIEAYDQSRPRNTQKNLGPSSVGKCLRQSAYRWHDVPPSDERSRARARLGSLLHGGYAEVTRSQGHSAEVEIEVPGLGTGHADDVDYRTRTVNDLKSASARSFERYVTHGLPEYMWDQVELYAYGLSLRASQVEDWTIAVTLLNRETGQEARFERDADPERGAYLTGVMIARQGFLERSRTPEDIAREGAGPGRGFPCDYCDWLSTCWPGVEGDLSPQSATIAGDEEAIAQVLEDYLVASEAGGKIENAKKDARAFLTGIPPGQYADKKLSWSGGRDLDPEPDPAEAFRILEEMGITVPMRRRRSAVSIRVTRTRAGKPTENGSGKIEAPEVEPQILSDEAPAGPT